MFLGTTWVQDDKLLLAFSSGFRVTIPAGTEFNIVLRSDIICRMRTKNVEKRIVISDMMSLISVPCGC